MDVLILLVLNFLDVLSFCILRFLRSHYEDKGKIVTIFDFSCNKCPDMLVTLSMVTHLGQGHNSHKIQRLPALQGLI